MDSAGFELLFKIWTFVRRAPSLSRLTTHRSLKSGWDTFFNLRDIPKRWRVVAMASLQTSLDNWFVRNLIPTKTAMRIIIGVVWGIDGALKFQPGVAEALPGMISDAAQGQPDWLAPWFQFWSQAVSTNPAFFVDTIGLLELALSFSLLVGFLRKIAYTGGFLLSLLIWSVPEGLGGPYGPSSTDIGTGIIYAFIFLFLLIINAGFGSSRYSLDHLIERRWPAWGKAAEIRSTLRA